MEAVTFWPCSGKRNEWRSSWFGRVATSFCPALPTSPRPPERACGASLRLDGRGCPSPHNHTTYSLLLLLLLLLLLERFFVHHVGHLGDVASVVPFQHVDQSLHTSSGHAFIGIG